MKSPDNTYAASRISDASRHDVESEANRESNGAEPHPQHDMTFVERGQGVI